ncbi:hypothetical protein QZH41_010916, partial [Actinostola sp. cb2023]
SVFVDRFEEVLHIHYGQQDYWEARRSLVFAKHLRNEGDKFRREQLNSSDEDDETVMDDDWRNNQKKEGTAKGGQYLAIHLRRADFLYAHPEKVPSLDGVVKQIKKLLKRHKLKKVFLATDADGKVTIADAPDTGVVVVTIAGAPDTGVVVVTIADTPDTGVVVVTIADTPDTGVVVVTIADAPDTGVVVVTIADAPDTGVVVVTIADAPDTGVVVVTIADTPDTGVVVVTIADAPDTGVVIAAVLLPFSDVSTRCLRSVLDVASADVTDTDGEALQTATKLAARSVGEIL